MLDIFRTAAKTWIVKLLFAFLALSFVAWGVGDYTRNRPLGTGPAITVGSVDVSASEVEEEFKRDFQRMQGQFGGHLTPDDARKLGFLDNTIQAITTRLLVDEAARRLGLTVSDATVIRAVANDPNLKDDQGQVDRERLRAALSRMGLSEQAFLKIARAEQTRNQLAMAMTAGIAAPKSLVDGLARRRFEERVADTVTVADSAVPVPAAPTAEQIETFYKANTKLFMAPEYRALTILLLRPADVDNQIQISDEEIAGAYDQHAAEFNIPEKRQASQILLTDQAQADKAGELVKEGRDITAIAKTLNAQILDLGTVTQAELPQELSDPVFSESAGKTFGPVRSDLGWHVIKIYSVTKPEVKKLETVKPQLIDELHKQKTADALSAMSSKVDDALGGGASLEDAANTFGLKLVKLPGVDQKGMDANSRPAADLPKGANLLDVAFHTDQGTESQMTENGADGYFLVRVDSVTAPAPRPLAAVKTTVASTLAAENRHASAKQKAEALAESLKTGTPVSAIDKTPGITVKTTAAFTRDGGHADDLPPALVGQLFDKAVGDVAVADASTGWVVARLAAVKPVDLAQRPDAVKTIATSLSQSVASDLADELLAGLNAQIGVKIDRSQLSREE